MKPELQGQLLKSIRTKAHAVKMAELEKILDTPTASETARIMLFFGVTASWDLGIPHAIGVDMENVLMAGHEIEWQRPFEPDEPIVIDISLASVTDRGARRFAVVESVFSTPDGAEIQRQHSTFTQPLAEA